MGKTISMAVFNSYVKLPEGRIWTRSLTAAGVTGSDGLPAVWLAVVAPKLGTWTGTAGTMPLEIKESQVKLGYICWIWAWNRKMAKKKTRNIIYQTSSYFIYIYIFGSLSCRVSKSPFATEEISSQAAMHPTSRISQKFVQQIMLKYFTLSGWWFGTFGLFSHHIGNFIIPTDELIFFRWVGIPPTSCLLPMDNNQMHSLSQ